MSRLHGGRFPFVETAVVVLAVAALVGLTVLQSGHKSGPQITYSTYDATPGGLRGWFELLQREGVVTTRFEERLAFLGSDVRVLIRADSALAIQFSDDSRADGTALAKWVRAGGRLLMAGAPILPLFGKTDLELRSPVTGTPHSRPSVAPGLRALGVRTVTAAGGTRLRARKGDSILLRDDSGVVALRYALGRGQVVQVTDGSIFLNSNIGSADRPRFAYALVALLDPRGRVAFDEALHGYVAPEHWWLVLPRRFVAGVLLAILVLAVALVGSATRLGPARNAEPARAPNSTEYLDALATLMERARAVRAALRGSVLSARRLVASRIGASSESPAAEFATRIDDLQARQAFLVLDALAADPAPSNAELVRALALVHRLREEYGTEG